VRVVIVTVVHGRHDHLRGQRSALGNSTVRPDQHVVVAVDDPGAPNAVAPAEVPTRICPISTGGSALPIATARNRGAREAIECGAELIVFLDVDCLPSPALVERYVHAAEFLPEALLSGPVAYLDPPPPGGYDLHALAGTPAHPARPVPPDDAVVRGADHRLFWSLSFAVTAPTWQRLGGFCERYTGYGAEDTDLGQVAARAGIDHAWVGGAWAYHQHHPVSDPPTEHAADIVRNANVFHDRWGWWPMTGWLDAFAARGLARHEGERWSYVSRP
jgi:GT2 family glycosyltransferase